MSNLGDLFRQARITKAEACFMAGDYEKVLEWLSEPVTENERALILRTRLAAGNAAFKAGRLVEALRWLGEPQTREARILAARCHYHLMKRVCADEDFDLASEHGRAALRLKAASGAENYFIQERLRIIGTEPPSADGAPHQEFELGVAMVDGFEEVPVLGRYGTWGLPGGLTSFIRLLKRPVEELSLIEERERPLLINLAGYILARFLAEKGMAAAVDMILPIPSDPFRYSARGFSPQDLVAQAVSAYGCIPLSLDSLLKVHSTRKLSEIEPHEREDELAGSMEVSAKRSHLVSGSNIMLLDDLVTYGTTLREAARVLLNAGANSVYACALATARDNYVSKNDRSYNR